MQEQQPQGAPARRPEEPDLGDRLKLAGAAIAVAALVLFFFQNLQEVEINFLWMDWNTQMIWALLVSAVLGAAGTFLASTIRRRGQSASGGPEQPPQQR